MNKKTEEITDEGVSQIEAVFPESCITKISHDQLREQKSLKISFPENCDSLRIYFPAGGTVTGATLYKDSLLKESVGSTPSFGIMEDSIGFMSLSNKSKGKFFLVYGSCHWGSRMWIELE